MCRSSPLYKTYVKMKILEYFCWEYSKKMRKNWNAEKNQNVLTSPLYKTYVKMKILEYFEWNRNVLVRMLKQLMENQKHDISSKIDVIHSREENTIRSLLEDICMHYHYKGLGVAGAAYNDTRMFYNAVSREALL